MHHYINITLGNYIKITLGILLALGASRLIPHPPNFTSLLALSFYIPAFLGIIYIPALIFCFLITDLIIGFHDVVIFTWGSVVIIGLITRYFNKNIYFRISGALIGCCLFFLITNLGVWSLGSYSYSINGLLLCYTLALPFFTYTLISTFMFSGIIEFMYSFFKKKTVNN